MANSRLTIDVKKKRDLRCLSQDLETGSVSISFVFFIIIVLTSMGVVSYSVMSSDSRLSVKYLQSSQAHFLAEAGMEYGISKVFDGQGAPYSETVSVGGNSFTLSISDEDSVLRLISTGYVDVAEKGIEVFMLYRPPIGDFAIYSTGEVTNVTSLNEAGDPDPSLMVENAPSLPDIDDQALIDLATSQGQVESVATFSPAHGYPNFNFYNTGSIPNVTYVQGDLKVKGGRTVYGIFMVEGNIYLEGSSRVEGVLYMTTPTNIVIHGGGSPTESSVTGGIVANGDVDGTGNHITVHYNSEYMQKFEEYEDASSSVTLMSWREL